MDFEYSEGTMKLRREVEEFMDAEIERRQHDIAKSRGFQLQEHALSLYAHCTRKDCAHRAKQ